MKKRYTDGDLSQFFIHFQRMTNNIELSNISQIINSPASHTKIERGLSDTLKLKLLLWVIGGISLISTIAIYINNTGNYLPDDASLSSVIIDSTKEEASRIGRNRLVLENEISIAKKVSVKADTEITHESNMKQDSIEMSASKNTKLSICDDYSKIDTSVNYFKLNDTIYEIKSGSQFKDTDWKYELDLNYQELVWIHLNFISEGEVNYGSYEISMLQINKMPYFSFYGALFYEGRKIKLNEGSICIEHKGTFDQIIFKLGTIEGDTISGHYRGNLNYTAPE